MEYLKVGEIVNTHGIKGEVKIYPYTDDIINLSKTKFFYIDNVKTKVKKCSVFKNMLIVSLDNVLDIDVAKKMLGKYVYIPKEEIKEENVYYVEDLTNMEVYKTYEESLEYDKYEYLGKITYVYTNAANDVYEVKNGDVTVLLPAISQVVKKVDIASKKMYVKMMEGFEN